MSKFRKKPVVIEAFQVGSSRFYPEWLHEAVSAGVVVTYAREGSDGWKEPFDHADIQTLEGVMRADRGDWIIRGVEGELYPCKDSIFRQTYEPAEDGEPPAQPRRPYGTDTMSEYGVIPECDGPKPPAQQTMSRDREVWRAALTLANNICVQASDRYNGDDATQEASAINYCAQRIRDWIAPTDEQFAELLEEAGIGKGESNA